MDTIVKQYLFDEDMQKQLVNYMGNKSDSYEKL